jgi:3-(3-hydroxy-phenyl)propionate hydroxylase
VTLHLAGEPRRCGALADRRGRGAQRIRRETGIGFEGMTIPEIFLTMSTPHRFEETIPDLAPIAYISDPDEWLVLLRTPTLWRVLLPTDPGAERGRDEGARADRGAAAGGLPQGRPYPVTHATAYRVHERVAESYVRGGCCWPGDAAHLNNPLGGMGMNGGIHDAFNLAEKLDAVWHGAPTRG